MEEGQLIKAVIPQADGKVKERPALLLKRFPPYGDWLAAGISSKIENRSDLDVLLDEDHPDFLMSGLRKPGLIRTGFLGTIPEVNIPGSIGSISKKTHQELIQNLVEHLERG